MKILVVDDSASLRRLLCKELVVTGYQVDTASDGEEALAACTREKYDLMTLDVEMPNLNGYETCRRLREKEQREKVANPTPVIFLTANDSAEEREKGFHAGAVDFITKPFVEGELASTVRHILEPHGVLKNMNALIIEDCPATLALLCACLRAQGMHVYSATNGREGLELAKTHRNTLDLILTDYDMPEKNGLEVCQAVRQDLGLTQVPIIALSGMVERQYILSLFKAGANDFIIKPFVKEELLARIRVHAELRQRNREQAGHLMELKRLHKLKSRFLALASHDLRAPLMGILGIPEMLDQEEYIKPEHKELLKLIGDSGRFLLHIVDDLLDLSRLQFEDHKLEFKPLRMADLTNSTVAVLHHMAAPKRVALNFEDQTQGHDVVEGDFNALRRALNNLISNAIKFTPSGGKVHVVLATHGEEHLTLTVTDTGIGMPAEMVAKLFNPLGNVSRPGTQGEHGTGLGMAIVKEIVNHHGGKIEVQSAPNQGTTIRVDLPVSLLADKAIPATAEAVS